MGKLYDDRGNRMSPSFSCKNGVRYRFYVSSALLRGRRAEAGSVGRVSATEIERAALTALQPHQGREKAINGHDPFAVVERVVVARDHLLLTIASSDAADITGATREIRSAWSPKTADPVPAIGSNDVQRTHNEVLVQSVVRAHTWAQSLRDETYWSVENLAEANGLHPKVVRQALRLAFLSPDVTSAFLEGRQPAGLSLARIPKLLPFSWTEHWRLIG
jgi:site-specific DNA recombinase